MNIYNTNGEKKITENQGHMTQKMPPASDESLLNLKANNIATPGLQDKSDSLSSSSISVLKPYLSSNAVIFLNEDNLSACEIPALSTSSQANIYFFGHPIWGKEYFETSHRHDKFRDRWQAATGRWDGKVVIDVGCGPGNLYATVGGSPKVLIGIDIAAGALKMAEQVGYTPLLADAHCLPLADSCADLVVANAAIHHCDDMAKVLAEAARLVKPGGLLVTDKDPQSTALNLKGIGLFLREIRFIFYWLIRSKYYIPVKARKAREATETHNRKPGDGITPEVYRQVLEPLGFDIKLFPHNHDLGVEVLEGKIGRMSWKRRLAQRLSGIPLDTPESAQSIMCIAQKIR
jgi:ubiquinone/menaquinone biosynthesis C-methylase UbiE